MLRIAIDGLSSTGKSSLANELAKHYGIMHFNSGVYYRMTAIACLEAGINPDSEEEVLEILKKTKFDVRFENKKQKNFLNGLNIDNKLLELRVSTASSKVSRHSKVRKILTEFMVNFAKNNSLVMDGRDIAHNVIPNAEAKIILKTDFAKRVKMRLLELQEKGIKASKKEVEEDFRKRDDDEFNRPVVFVNPLSESIVIDNTNLTLKETTALAVELIDKKIGETKGDKRTK